MYKHFIFTSIVFLTFSNPTFVQATNAVDSLLAEYRSLGAANFSVAAGKKLWSQEFIDKKSGKIRQCTSCHTDDLRQMGKHARSGKVIEPLAPSVNSERLIDLKKIRKWFKRNCKWTLGRECTPQEKGDSLTFIQAQ